MFNKLLKISLAALVFLFPIFWLPFSFEWIEFNKLYLMLFLGVFGVLMWLLKMIFQDKEIKVRFSVVDWVVLAFLFLGLVSAIFSIDRISSIFGTYGRFSNGFLALFSFICLYFLARNNFNPLAEKNSDFKEKESGESFDESAKTDELTIGRGIKLMIKDGLSKSKNLKKTGLWSSGLSSENIFALLFWGAFFATIWSVVWVVGIGQRKALFSFVSGSANGFAIYLSLMISLVLSTIILNSEKEKLSELKRGAKAKKGLEIIFVFLAFFLLLVFDYSAAWIVLGGSLIFFIIFSVNKGLIKENIYKLVIPIFFIVVCCLFLITNTFWIFSAINNNFLRFPAEPILWQGESLKIGFLSAKANIKNFFLGSGIGTFISDYAMFKSDKMNEGLLWQIRFDRAGNNFAEVLATTGFLGLGLFLAIIFLAVKKFGRQKKGEGTIENQIIWQSVFVGAILAQIFFYQNMVLGGIFWLVLAVSANFSESQEKKFSVKDRPAISILFESFVVIFLIILLMVLFFGVKFYGADLKYAKAINTPEIDKKINLFGEAINLNRYQPQYQIAMSQVLIIKLGQEIARTDISLEEKQKILAAYLDILNRYAKNAVSISPNQIMTRQNLANIYRDFIGIAGGAEEWALASYGKAIELEPKNPVLYVERGKVYEASNKKDEARSDFEKAKEMAPSYPAATLTLALLEEKEGKNDKAIALLEDFLDKFLNRYGFSASADIVFNLGRLYYNNGQNDQAIDILEVARLAMPQDSNILYVLGLAYQKKGNTEEAKKLIERVLELNPGNEEVKKKLEELGGKGEN